MVDRRFCDHENGWCLLWGDLTVRGKAETADGTTLWDREVGFTFPELQEIDPSQVPDEVNEPLRHQRLTDDELRVVQLLHEAIAPAGTPPYPVADTGFSIKAALDYARRRYAVPWPDRIAVDAGYSTVVVGAGEGEPITLTNQTTDTLEDFTPLGWSGFGEVHWWGDPDTPIFNELCAEWRNAGRPTPPIMRG